MERIVRNSPTATYTCIRDGQTFSFVVRDGGCVGVTANCKTVLAARLPNERNCQ